MLRPSVRILLLLALVAGLYALNRSGAIQAAIDGVASLGPWAIPAFLVLHVACVVALMPSVAPCIAAGAIFGVAWGLPVSVLGAGLGAITAFGLGRTVGRRWVEERFGHDVRFEALSTLARERGWKIVAMARLTPVFPFSIANYAFGVTPLRGRDYLLATMAGTIPTNAVYVYLGTMAGQLTGAEAAVEGRSAGEWALLALGLVTSVILALYLRRVASEVLDSDSET